MIVVSNASPLRYLIVIHAVHVLPQLFGEVYIPPAVHRELSQSGTPSAVRDFMASPPSWLNIKAPVPVEPTLRVHIGEAEAILLAKELSASRLLMDDRKAIQAARDRGVAITRTPAVLVLAAERGLVDLTTVFERLKRTNFRIPPKLLDDLLREFPGTSKD